MAATSGRSESIAVALSDRAFGSLMTELKFSKEDAENIFGTIASACKTTGERWLYLQTVKALGANPFKKDVYAVRTRKQENGQWVDGVDFRVSYHYVTGVTRAAGYVVVSAQHWSADTWGGWDAVAGQPVQHVQKPGARGVLLGAWARAVPIKPGCSPIGAYLPLDEIVPMPLFKDRVKASVFESILAGAYGPFWHRMPGRMAEKCVVAHVGRRVCPDLGAAYVAEEFGEVIDVEAIDVTKRLPESTEPAAPEKPAVDAPIDVVAEVKTAEPVAPPPAPSSNAEPTTDQLILAALEKLKNKVGSEKTRIAIDLAKAKDGTPMRGKDLLEYLEDAERTMEAS